MDYQALHGIRVLDLGIITAGASTSAILADLGAEVIKIEGPSYTDPFRDWMGTTDAENWWNDSPQFRATNRNKRSVCLDLKSEQGHALFMRLVGQSDIVVENFRTGVLARLKIGFDRLQARNPRIILASISSQGQTGPDAQNSSFGSTLEASSGFSYLMRYPDEAPKITGRGLNYPDQVASLFSAGAIMAAVIERHRTGEGTHLDLSQRELTSFLVGDALIAAADDGRPDAYTVGPGTALEGLFQSLDGEWLAVTVESQSGVACADLIGSLLDRESLSNWIAAQPAAVAARRLRSASAAAEVVVQAGKQADPYRMSQVSAFMVDDHGIEVKGLPFQIGSRHRDEFRSAPALGEDNESVAFDLMNLNSAEYESLEKSGVFSDHPQKA
jgi:crotonobetainyl-CoA:carnitine CoA-transferase CaiB-like acyl-CoA transferase